MRAPLALALGLLVAACAAKRVSLEEAHMRVRAAAADSEARYEAALADAGMVPAPPPSELLFVAAGDPLPERFVAVGSWIEHTPRPADASFARDRLGRLWRVQRQPDLAPPLYLHVPGCRARYRGGETPAEFNVGYVLPPGVELAGTKPVRYAADDIQLIYRDGACDYGSAAP